MSTPRVSVVIPVYNGLPWLHVSAESVLTQTFQDFELLLVDDGSTDGSGPACDALADRDGRVRVLRHEGGSNRGVVETRNRGLSEARAAYVANLDADDLMYPERLARQVAHLDGNPRIALVGSQVDWAGPSGSWQWSVPTEPHLARWTLLLENCFMGGGVTMRRDAARAVGGYDPAFDVAEDFDLWDRLAARYDVVNLPETLAWYNNLRTKNLSTVHARHMEALALAISTRGIRRYVPSATETVIEDVYMLGRGRGWPGGAVPAGAAQRAAAASDLLIRLHREFLTREAVPKPAQRDIRADLDGRLMRIRFALVSLGGAGRLARLHRPRWDRRGLLLHLPALVSR